MTKRANDFLIWRAGSSVDWDCTQQEIADEVGLSHKTVWLACKRHGWRCIGGHVGGDFGRYATDTLMKSAHTAGRAET